MMTPIEHIDMEKLLYARLSFILLLDFAYKHNENLINDLDKPKVFENEKHLIMGNNAIYQLNVLENGGLTLERHDLNHYLMLLITLRRPWVEGF
jgi:hypothetical protein